MNDLKAINVFNVSAEYASVYEQNPEAIFLILISILLSTQAFSIPKVL